MTEHLQSARAVLLCVKEKLASGHAAKPADVLDDVVATLSRGRGYLWTGIYLAVEGLSVRQASSESPTMPQHAKTASSTTPVSISLDDVRAEIAVPIRLGVRTLGLMVAETGRASILASQERALLQQVAKLLAKYLTTDRSKQLLRTTRTAVQAEKISERLHKSPQSARPATRKAAAGERIPR